MTTDYTVQHSNGCEGSNRCKDLKNATFVTLITYSVLWNWCRYSVSDSSFQRHQPNMEMLFAHLFLTVHVMCSTCVKINITGVSPPLSSNDTFNSNWQTKSYTNKNPLSIKLIDIISLTINLILTRAFMLSNKMDLPLSIQKYSYIHFHIIHISTNIPARITTLLIYFTSTLAITWDMVVIPNTGKFWSSEISEKVGEGGGGEITQFC
jgi:hypothetical protein